MDLFSTFDFYKLSFNDTAYQHTQFSQKRFAHNFDTAYTVHTYVFFLSTKLIVVISHTKIKYPTFEVDASITTLHECNIMFLNNSIIFVIVSSPESHGATLFPY